MQVKPTSVLHIANALQTLASAAPQWKAYNKNTAGCLCQSKLRRCGAHCWQHASSEHTSRAETHGMQCRALRACLATDPWTIAVGGVPYAKVLASKQFVTSRNWRGGATRTFNLNSLLYTCRASDLRLRIHGGAGGWHYRLVRCARHCRSGICDGVCEIGWVGGWACRVDLVLCELLLSGALLPGWYLSNPSPTYNNTYVISSLSEVLVSSSTNPCDYPLVFLSRLRHKSHKSELGRLEQ
jgi:hypothetical protein